MSSSQNEHNFEWGGGGGGLEGGGCAFHKVYILFISSERVGIF